MTTNHDDLFAEALGPNKTLAENLRAFETGLGHSGSSQLIILKKSILSFATIFFPPYLLSSCLLWKNFSRMMRMIFFDIKHSLSP